MVKASIWDSFTHKKGKVHQGDNDNAATDFYHRYAEDIALLKRMNFKVFRFSISWSRIFPSGTGEINQKGVEFYHKVTMSVLRTTLSLGLPYTIGTFLKH